MIIQYTAHNWDNVLAYKFSLVIDYDVYRFTRIVGLFEDLEQEDYKVVRD